MRRKRPWFGYVDTLPKTSSTRNSGRLTVTEEDHSRLPERPTLEEGTDQSLLSLLRIADSGCRWFASSFEHRGWVIRLIYVQEMFCFVCVRLRVIEVEELSD